MKLSFGLNKRKFVAVSALIAISCLAFAQATRNLIINGKVVSSDVRVIGGRSYAPVSELAKALDMVAIQRPDGSIELTRQGGSGAIDAKLTGKMDEWLFDGGWRFKVTKVSTAQTYKRINLRNGTEGYDAGEDQKLILIDYAIRNGNKKMRAFHFGDVALAGDSGTSEPGEGNDFPFGVGNIWRSKDTLPGSEIKGTLIFAVAKDFNEKDLIVTLNYQTGYDESVQPKEESVIRISLK